jgi:hypothetical protein
VEAGVITPKRSAELKQYREILREEIYPVSWAWLNPRETGLPVKKPIFPITEVQYLVRKWAVQKEQRRRDRRMAKLAARRMEGEE